jgi:uncharacterized membrane protein
MNMAHQKNQDLPTAVRLIIASVIGVIAGMTLAGGHSLLLSLLMGWDAAAFVYLIAIYLSLHKMGSTETSTHAVREDSTITVSHFILVIASVVSIVGEIVVELGGKSSHNGLQITVALAGVALAWILVHTTFMLRYARMYYSKPRGGIDFNQSSNPTYLDFAYLAFTLGMTFQVSDTVIQARQIRSTALRHALLSYLFGAVILASTVNLIAGLASK